MTLRAQHASSHYIPTRQEADGPFAATMSSASTMAASPSDSDSESITSLDSTSSTSTTSASLFDSASSASTTATSLSESSILASLDALETEFKASLDRISDVLDANHNIFVRIVEEMDSLNESVQRSKAVMNSMLNSVDSTLDAGVTRLEEPTARTEGNDAPVDACSARTDPELVSSSAALARLAVLTDSVQAMLGARPTRLEEHTEIMEANAAVVERLAAQIDPQRVSSSEDSKSRRTSSRKASSANARPGFFKTVARKLKGKIRRVLR